MKIESARYIGCATDLESCPHSNLPEFAFVGRSNVGKSSLVNMLADVKGLAKTSGTPGKTKLINFFRINDRWTLVDLPGYGFAKVSRAKQSEFNESVSGYLNGRENLKQVFALLDSQLEPLETDLAFIDWLQQCGIPYSIILTKTDRSADSKVINHEDQLIRALEDYGLNPNEIFKCSAKTKRGRGAVLNWVESQLPKATKKKGKSIQLGWMKK
ncbi:MAG: YihA family ribosome biogenesis GTP-binding protein [Puniceicoccaceae bacterium]|nr:YihA family ribosome biogenesis GTP-binding protein [Puniceicoccaceae bacterium]MBL6912712.1 YihA family ribosome biogenesis GTP-binding protein [Puniceicoccaceae bacterium]